MRALVAAPGRSTHARAIWARLCPRPAASSFRRRRAGVVAEPDVERLPAAYRVVERLQRLLQGRLGVRPVVIVDVHVVEIEPAERLIEARQQILAGAAVAIGAGSHPVAGLRR